MPEEGTPRLPKKAGKLEVLPSDRAIRGINPKILGPFHAAWHWYFNLPLKARTTISLGGVAALGYLASLFFSQFNQVRSMGLAYSRLMLAGLEITLSLMFLIVLCQIWKHKWAAIGVSIAVPIFIVVALDYFAPKPPAPIPAPTPELHEPVIALAMQCSMSLGPIVIPAHEKVGVMLLSAKPVFVIEENVLDHPIKWPTFREATIPKGKPPDTYECAVNSLNQSVEDVAIPLQVTYGKEKEITVSMQSPLIAQNQTSVFHLVNQCPIPAAVVIPNVAKLKLLGDTTTRLVPLRGADPNSVGKMMFFFPSDIRWSSKPKCF